MNSKNLKIRFILIVVASFFVHPKSGQDGEYQWWISVAYGNSVDNMKNQVSNLEAQQRQLESDNIQLQQRINSMNSQKKSRESALQNERAKLSKTKNDIGQRKKTLADIEGQKKILEKARIEEEQEILQKKSQKIQLEREEEIATANLASKEDELKKIEQEKNRLNKVKVSLETEKLALTNDIDSIQNQVQAANDALDVVEKEAVAYENPDKINELTLNMLSKLSGIQTGLEPLFTQIGGIYVKLGEHDHLICNAFRVSSYEIKAPASCVESESRSPLIFRNISDSSGVKVTLKSKNPATNIATLTLISSIEGEIFPVGSLDPYSPVQLIFKDPITDQLINKPCRPSRSTQGSFYEHDCQTPSGANGGVFFQNLKIVGIHYLASGSPFESMTDKVGVGVAID